MLPTSSTTDTKMPSYLEENVELPALAVHVY